LAAYFRDIIISIFGSEPCVLKKLLFLSLILLTACGRDEKPMVSFYYWKTVFRLSDTEREVLLQNDVKRLYIRYFDIALKPKTREPIPQSPIRFTAKPTTFEVIPVVYIKNEVFLQQKIDISALARETADYVNQINRANKISCSEIQIDCDWTLSSRDQYLAFIKAFRLASGKKLSATIRLHQVKYARFTKVPAVDRCVLMYYNMGKIAPDSLNSIYDREIAKRYLGKLDEYPLPLDIALPVYSWAVHVRAGKVIGLRSKVCSNDLEKDANFKFLPNGWFRVKRSHFRSGVFYRENDCLKPESASASQLVEMAGDLSDKLGYQPKEIIFYDLDELNFRNYDKNIFTETADRF
jgi:hypothetical protein